jgi:hypothetical protein
VLVLASCLAAPALAASDRGILCDKDQEATLDIAGHELALASHEAGDSDIAESVATTIDSVADDHLLKPRVEATAREVFADGESDTEFEEALEVESDDEPAVPRLHRMSDNELVPFRRQMFRKDI